MIPDATNRFTDSDHLLAYHLHIVTGKKEVKLKDADYKLIALSRRTKRTRASWSRKVGNFDAIRDGGTQTGNAEQVYVKFKSEYEGNPADAIIRISNQLEPFSDDARNLFLRIGIPGNLLKAPSADSKQPYFSVIQKSDIVRAAEMMLEGERPSGFNESNTYDVIVEGKAFAPKPLVAIAYKLAGGTELRGADFEGGRDTECFKCLEKYDFKLILKHPNTETNDMNTESSLNTEQRLICALAAKPFVILAGGTGTGKTKSAIETVIKLCNKPTSALNSDQFAVIPVGADWTDTRPLIGYENVLRNPSTYTVPPALRVILAANRNAQQHDETKGASVLLPYFLILDEMNLSHVERYFSDFLSLMEAKKIDASAAMIELHGKREGMPSTDDPDSTVPSSVPWPRNLFVIGTVNIDETAHTFSPKVLDRAHVIEYKPATDDVLRGITQMIKDSKRPDEESQRARIENQGKFSEIGQELVMSMRDKLVAAEDGGTLNSSKDAIGIMLQCLQTTKFAFSHRTAQEAAGYVLISKWILNKHQALLAPAPRDEVLIDYAILQKILPKINGSTESLFVISLDGKESKPLLTELRDKACGGVKNAENETTSYTYAKSAEKLKQMQDTLVREHFVSFIQ